MSEKQYFLFANPNKPKTISAVRDLAKLLLERKCRVLLDQWLYDLLLLGESCALHDLSSQTNAIISLGGDGTLLRTLPSAAQKQIPVLGVNLGHAGFLLEIGPEDLTPAIDRLVDGDWETEERMMLRCVINSDFSALAANEVALTRGQSPGSLIVDVFAGEELIFSIHGDGVLVSTPTGTTGYALSAGGPVIDPSLECLTIVPICSHIMHQRPVVLPPDRIVRLIVRTNKGKLHQISIDGQIVLDLKTDTQVLLHTAREKARFIRFGPSQFITRLQQKQTQYEDHISEE